MRSLQLKKFHETAARNSPLLELIKPAEGGQLPLGLIVHTRSGGFDDRGLNYQTDAPEHLVLHEGERRKLTFSAALANGLKVSKTVELEGSGYVFNLDAAAAGAPGEVQAIGLNMSEPLTPHQGYYDIPEIQALVNNKTAVDAEKALRKGPPPLKGKITYAGFGDRYFLTVFLPRSADDGTVAMDYNGLEATATMMFSPQPADGTVRLATQVYTGPKSLNQMEQVNPQLRRSIDFGWTGILALAFLRALKLFHYIAPNWGIDIILLTVAIRVAFLPISIKSQRSMMRLQRLQPQVEKMREKFKDDRDRLNREMVDLYKRNHVNPLGGCAPMLLQLPIFIGLVRGAAQRRGVAACAVRRLDPGPLGAGMPGDSALSQAELFALRRNSGAGHADGVEHLPAADDVAAVARPQPAADDDADADRVHHHVPEFSGGPYALLFLLQRFGHRPAIFSQPRIQTAQSG